MGVHEGLHYRIPNTYMQSGDSVSITRKLVQFRYIIKLNRYLNELIVVKVAFKIIKLILDNLIIGGLCNKINHQFLAPRLQFCGLDAKMSQL